MKVKQQQEQQQKNTRIQFIRSRDTSNKTMF